MRKYGCVIMDIKEAENIMGEKISFNNGFLNDRCNTWELAKYLNVPIISIRPSGRESWNEIIIIYAEGYVDIEKQKIHLLTDTVEDAETILLDIFADSEVDEYEVFDGYIFDNLKPEDYENLVDWLHDIF